MPTPYILVLFSILISIIGYIWTQQNTKIQEIKAEVKDHAIRVQRLEDVQGNKIDALSEEFRELKMEMKTEISALKDMVHKDKNMEHQLNVTLGLLLKELQKDK